MLRLERLGGWHEDVVEVAVQRRPPGSPPGRRRGRASGQCTRNQSASWKRGEAWTKVTARAPPPRCPRSRAAAGGSRADGSRRRCRSKAAPAEGLRLLGLAERLHHGEPRLLPLERDVAGCDRSGSGVDRCPRLLGRRCEAGLRSVSSKIVIRDARGVIHRDPFKAGSLQGRTVIVQDRAGRGRGRERTVGWCPLPTNCIMSKVSVAANPLIVRVPPGGKRMRERQARGFPVTGQNQAVSFRFAVSARKTRRLSPPEPRPERNGV